ncbi:hypothetical protein SHKM778_43620 [Streptomyces sp. KM77-8]|uniref:Condensation domain-containing protein n=1 Tax=Streptomyces haneummycinicus TaxID=3074435 RepID=A0AAT9HKT1_9ACTN
MFLHRTPRALAGHLATLAPRPTVTPAPARPAHGPVVPTPIILRRRELGGSLAGFAQARVLAAPDGTGFADAVRAANAVVAAHPALRLRLRTEHGVWTLSTEPVREVTVVPTDTTDPELRRTRPPLGSTPRPGTSSRSPGWKPHGRWSSPSTTSPWTPCPG